jgi:CheY-like chemotaxis protein
MIPTLLCVDDDKMTLMLLRLILEKAKFCKTLLTAENGALALNYFDAQMHLEPEEQNFPAVILLDLNMPVLNGWEFLSSFAQKFAPIASRTIIFILSSSVDPFEKEKANEHPLVAEFLPKPLSIAALEQLKKHPALRAFFITA